MHPRFTLAALVTLLAPVTSSGASLRGGRGTSETPTSDLLSATSTAGKALTILLNGDFASNEHELSISDIAEAAKVNVAWTYSMEEAKGENPILVRYMVDGTVVKTTAWEGPSGEAALNLDRVGDYNLTVAVCNIKADCSSSDPVKVTVVDGLGKGDPSWERSLKPSSSSGMPLQEASAWAEATSKELELQTANIPSSERVPIYDSVWLAKFLGKKIFSKLAGTGLDFLWKAIFGGGGDSGGPSLRDVLQSIDEVNKQIDDLGKRLIQRFADSDFKNAHRDTLRDLGNIRDLGRLVAQNKTVDDDVLKRWTEMNYFAAGTLKDFLLNSVSGAIPLMLNLYTIQYPTTGLVEVRSDIVNYVESVRATFGVALLNQAWLQEQYPGNDWAAEPLKEISVGFIEEAYALIGATYPAPAGKPVKFLHRVGSKKALVDSSNSHLIPGEPGSTKETQLGSEVDALLADLGALNTDAWRSTTISEYMEQKGFDYFLQQKPYNDPATIRHTQSNSGFLGYWTHQDIWYNTLYMSGNQYQRVDFRAFHSEGCATYKCRVKTLNEAWALESELSSRFAREEFMYYRDDVEMNGAGMPALMDPTLIAQERDGILVQNQTESTGADGTHVIALSVIDHYGSGSGAPTGVVCGPGVCGYRAVDPIDGKEIIPYFTKESSILRGIPDAGALVLEAGYRINNQEDFVVREIALVDGLAGQSAIRIALDY